MNDFVISTDDRTLDENDWHPKDKAKEQLCQVLAEMEDITSVEEWAIYKFRKGE